MMKNYSLEKISHVPKFCKFMKNSFFILYIKRKIGLTFWVVLTNLVVVLSRVRHRNFHNGQRYNKYAERHFVLDLNLLSYK